MNGLVFLHRIGFPTTAVAATATALVAPRPAIALPVAVLGVAIAGTIAIALGVDDQKLATNQIAEPVASPTSSTKKRLRDAKPTSVRLLARLVSLSSVTRDSASRE